MIFPLEVLPIKDAPKLAAIGSKSIVEDSYLRLSLSATDVDGLVHTVGIFSGTNSAARDISLPRIERNDLNSNLYIYRREIISPYEYNVSDGIYHLYVLK